MEREISLLLKETISLIFVVPGSVLATVFIIKERIKSILPYPIGA